MFIDPVTKCKFPYTPFGRIIHTPPLCPRTDWANDFGRPWWKNESYCIGLLSQKTRKVRIVNTLTSQEQALEVSVWILFFVVWFTLKESLFSYRKAYLHEHFISLENF